MRNNEPKLISNVVTKVPAVVSTRINETLQSLPRKKKSNNWGIVIPSAATLLIASILTFSFSSQNGSVKLSNSLSLESAFNIVGDSGLSKLDKAITQRNVGQSISTENLTFTVTDTMFDGTRLVIGYHVSSTKKVSDFRFIYGDLTLEVNGDVVGSPGGKVDDQNGESGEYTGIIAIEPISEMPNSFDLDLKFSKLGNEKGHWKLSVPITRLEGGKTFNLDETIQDKQSTIDFKKFTLTPATTELQFEISKPMSIAEEEFNNKNRIEYQIFDDKGYRLEPIGGNANGVVIEKDIYKETHELHFGPLNNYIPSSITVVPLRHGLGTEVTITKIPLNGTLPFDLDQGKIGKLIIEKIEKKGNQTIVTYKAKGEFQDIQANSLWIEDESGMHYSDKKHARRIERGNEYIFERTFMDLPLDKVLFITTEKKEVPEVIGEWKIELTSTKSKN